MSESVSEPFIFFIDRCLGKGKIVEALKAVDAIVEIHDDHFSQDALDVEWIPEIGQRGWIVLTKDNKIARNHIERQAVTYARIRMFSLVSQNLSGDQVAEAFTKAFPAMNQFLAYHPAPFITKVYRNGTIKAWKKAQELLAELQ